LDAVSSIRFPASFSSKERKVEITGQVYFEVAHDKTKPFRVTARGVTVEVLGTHFNINAYDDESTIKTTLLEGLIKISASGQTGLLKPGQQAQIGSTDSKIKIINEVDVEQVVDWMNGDFIFNGEDIYTTMRKISRWYDVDVVYQGSSKNLQLEGRVSRSKNISIVLKAMELTGKIHFKLEGRRITVMP
jgi:transmembrane sensor